MSGEDQEPKLESRQLTIEVEVDQPEANWIWESHLNGTKFHGMRVGSIEEGHVLNVCPHCKEPGTDSTCQCWNDE